MLSHGQCLPAAVRVQRIVRRCKVSHAAFSRFSNSSMAAKSSKRIRVRSDAARTVSPPKTQPIKIRSPHPVANSGATIHKAAVTAMSKTYMNGNQSRAKSLAPRTPYFRTNGESEMSDVFISSAKVTPNFDYATAVRLLEHKNPIPLGGARLANEAFRGDPDDRQVVPTGPNAVGTRCCASGATATRNREEPRSHCGDSFAQNGFRGYLPECYDYTMAGVLRLKYWTSQSQPALPAVF